MKKLLRALSVFLCLCSLTPLSAPAFAARSQTLDERIADFLSENQLNENRISFAYYNTVTGETYAYNEERLMIAGSTYKLPLNMYYYELEAQGAISSDAKFAGYTLSKCHELSLQYSENETSLAMLHAIGSYREFKSVIDKYTDVTAEEVGGEYLTENSFSAYMMMNVLKYLYENAGFFEEAIDYLKAAQPDAYFKKHVDGYEIAQKYGSKDGAVSTAGIIYTPSPYLLCVFTKGAGNAEDVIGRLNELFLEYTLENSPDAGKNTITRSCKNGEAKKNARRGGFSLYRFTDAPY